LCNKSIFPITIR